MSNSDHNESGLITEPYGRDVTLLVKGSSVVKKANETQRDPEQDPHEGKAFSEDLISSRGEEDLIQKYGEIEPMPPRTLPETYRAKINEDLDILVASLFCLSHLYQKFHWVAQGPNYHQLHEYFERSYNEVRDELDAVGERMTCLGGIPTSAPAKLQRISVVQPQTEGAFTNQRNLKDAFAAEGFLFEFLRAVIPGTTSNSDFATETLLKGLVLSSETRAHHIEHFFKPSIRGGH